MSCGSFLNIPQFRLNQKNKKKIKERGKKRAISPVSVLPQFRSIQKKKKIQKSEERREQFHW